MAKNPPDSVFAFGKLLKASGNDDSSQPCKNSGLQKSKDDLGLHPLALYSKLRFEGRDKNKTNKEVEHPERSVRSLFGTRGTLELEQSFLGKKLKNTHCQNF